MTEIMNFEPLVSIIIPVYNGSNYLREAIESAINQTYKNLEIIVVNDGSKDDGATEQIALSYGEKIRYIYKENGGVSSALNVGIKNMRGEYFSWLSHDDLYKQDKIEKQVELLRKFGAKNTIVLCESDYINDKSNCTDKGKRKKELKLGLNTYSEVLYSLCKRGSYIGCGFLISKKALYDAGLFDESLRYSQDAFMWLQLFINKYDLIYTDYVGVSNRIHQKQLTQRGREIFYRDSHYISKVIAPVLINEKKSSLLLYTFSKYFAKMNCKDALRECVLAGKEVKVLTLTQRAKLKFVLLYGKIRPLIRKAYYYLVRGIKTK